MTVVISSAFLGMLTFGLSVNVQSPAQLYFWGLSAKNNQIGEIDIFLN